MFNVQLWFEISVDASSIFQTSTGDIPTLKAKGEISMQRLIVPQGTQNTLEGDILAIT